MLQLCQISYDPSGIRKAVANLPPFRPGGKWFCVWGPAWNLIDSNLAFVAAYYDQNATSPMFTVVAVRGTDFDIWNPLGMLFQVWEDLDPENQVAVPWPSKVPGAMIAGGTYDGLLEIQGLTHGGHGLLGWLRLFLAQPGNSTTNLVVTGHSLGGCLTTVVAPWLQSALSIPIIPVTFAAPTAGNPAFAQDYGARFPVALRYQNPFDVIPYGYDNLLAIKKVYTSCANHDLPFEVDFFVGLMNDAIKGLTYVQPPATTPTLSPKCHQSDWNSEAAYQHATDTYMRLMNGKSFARPSHFVSRRGRGRPLVPPPAGAT